MGGTRKNRDEEHSRCSGCLESGAKVWISHGEGRAGGSVELWTKVQHGWEETERFPQRSN